MNVEVIRSVLLWCTIINYGILLVWLLAFISAHDPIQRLHDRWFHLSRDQFDVLHYGGMAIFKIGILLFNLIPFIAMSIVS
jgi:hypothetical protein